MIIHLKATGWNIQTAVKTDRSRVRRAKLAETAKARMEPLKTRATFSPAANGEFQAGDPIELLEFVGTTQPDSQSQAILYSAPIAFCTRIFSCFALLALCWHVSSPSGSFSVNSHLNEFYTSIALEPFIHAASRGFQRSVPGGNRTHISGLGNRRCS